MVSCSLAKKTVLRLWDQGKNGTAKTHPGFLLMIDTRPPYCGIWKAENSPKENHQSSIIYKLPPLSFPNLDGFDHNLLDQCSYSWLPSSINTYQHHIFAFAAWWGCTVGACRLCEAQLHWRPFHLFLQRRPSVTLGWRETTWGKYVTNMGVS